jgi:hypothetical protein
LIGGPRAGGARPTYRRTRRGEIDIESASGEKFVGASALAAFASYRPLGAVQDRGVTPPVTICQTCGHVGDPETMRVTHMVVGGLLCLAGLLPGLIYFAVMGSRYPRCASCGNRRCLVPATSPVGRRLLETLHPQLAVEPPTTTGPMPRRVDGDSPGEWFVLITVAVVILAGLFAWLASRPQP